MVEHGGTIDTNTEQANQSVNARSNQGTSPPEDNVGPQDWGKEEIGGQYEEAFTQSILTDLASWDEEDPMSRGSLDELVKDSLFTWWANVDPAIRANAYSSIVLMARVAPEIVTDVEVAILAFGGQDHHAAKAVDTDRADPEWLDGQWSVTFDKDWYDDNVHHGGSQHLDVTKAYLGELFGGEMEPGEMQNVGVKSSIINFGPLDWEHDAHQFTGPETPNEAMEAIESGTTVRRSEYPGLATGGDNAVDMAAGIMDGLAVVGQVAGVVMGLTTTAQMGAAPGVMRGVPGVTSGYPAKWPFPNPGGRLPTTNLPKHMLGPNKMLAPTSVSPGNPAVFRNMEAIRAVARPAGALKAASIDKLPKWMRLPSYVSMRTGQATQSVIQKGAESKYMVARGGGRTINRLAGTRLRASSTAAAATVVGSQGTNIYALMFRGDDVEEGRQAALQDNEDRLTAAQDKRQTQVDWEAGVLGRETERREQAREMYPSTEQPGVAP